MGKWAWKSLVAQRAWVAGSAAGIAFAFVLVIAFDAVWRGESTQIVVYIDKMSPDVWVMQRGVRNMHMATSFIWDWKSDRIADLPGVERVTPILYLSTVVTAGDLRSFSYVVGLGPGDARARPWELSAGRHIEDRGEAVVPEVLAKLAGVALGDSVAIADRSLEIVGLSAGTYSSANSITFVRMEDLEDVLTSAGSYSYLLVDAEEGVDAGVLAAEIMERVEKVHAMTTEDFIRSDFGMAVQMGVEIIFMMTMICLGLAALIVGFTSYSFVMRRQKEIAVVRALGASSLAVIRVVVGQAVATAMGGFIVAVAVAFVVLPWAPLLVPQLTLVIAPMAIAQMGLVALVVALVGALLPAYAVSRLDPATAFQV